MPLPLDISLHNDLNVSILFLPDGEQELFFEISNISDKDILLQDLTNDAEAFHFQLLFRPRVLRDIEKIQLLKRAAGNATVEGSERDTAMAESNSWELKTELTNPYQVSKDVGKFALLSLRYTGHDTTIAPGTTRLLLFKGVLPDGKLGTRASRVEIRHNVCLKVPVAATSANGQTAEEAVGEFKGVLLHHVNLLNISRNAFEAAQQVGAITRSRSGPFEATFLGSNIVANDGISTTNLRIRVSNRTGQPLKIQKTEGQKSKFTFNWDMTGGLQKQGLVRSEDQNAVTMTLDNDPDNPWTESGNIIEWDGATDEWPEDGFFDTILNITNSDAPAGFAAIKISFDDFPDQPSGTMELIAQIGPMFVIEEGQDLDADERSDLPRSEATGTALPLRMFGNNAKLEFFSGPFNDSNTASADASLKLDGKNLLLNVTGGQVASENLQIYTKVGIGADPDGFSSQLYVEGKTQLTGKVGIGANPEIQVQQLYVEGAVQLNGGTGIGGSPSNTDELKVTGSAFFTEKIGIGISPTGTDALQVIGNTKLVGKLGIGSNGLVFNDFKLKVEGDAQIDQGNLCVVDGEIIADQSKINIRGRTKANNYSNNRLRFVGTEDVNQNVDEFGNIIGHGRRFKSRYPDDYNNPEDQSNYLEIAASATGILKAGDDHILRWHDLGVDILGDVDCDVLNAIVNTTSIRIGDWEIKTGEQINSGESHKSTLRILYKHSTVHTFYAPK